MEHTVIDLMIRIKNGYMAGRESIESPYSKFKEAVLKQLVKLGFIRNYKVDGRRLHVELRYEDQRPAITDIKIMSKPGRRDYVSYKDLKPILGGIGFSLLSTPKGIITNKEARKMKIGGELLFQIW